MILITHIFIAVTSIILATGSLIAPTKKTLVATYVAIAATLASGIYLTASNPVRLAQTCLSGIIYIVIVGSLLGIAQKRLNTANNI